MDELTPGEWLRWFLMQSVDLRKDIVKALDSMERAGFTTKDSATFIYNAIVGHFKAQGLDEFGLPRGSMN